MAELSLQAQIPHNHCFGCGPGNKAGLNLESFWTGEGPSVACFSPQLHHCAAASHFVNGGILATLIDCHCVCTAIAAAYRDAGRPTGAHPQLYFATAAMSLQYRRPAPVTGPLRLVAEIADKDETGYRVSCELEVRGKTCVVAEVTAVQVSESWMSGQLQK